jgi:hypothetical protein
MPVSVLGLEDDAAEASLAMPNVGSIIARTTAKTPTLCANGLAPAIAIYHAC